LAPPQRRPNAGADARLGGDFEFVHEPLNARQPAAHPAASAETVLHRPRKVRYARPIVFSDDGDARAPVPRDDQETDHTAARGVETEVRRKLGHGSCQPRRRHLVETCVQGNHSGDVTRDVDVML